jgi:hypothetical protein
VSHCGHAICIKNAKEELWKLKIFHPCKNIIFKKSSKRNQNPSRYYNSIITNLKFQLHKPKYHYSKILIKKIDLLLLLPRGQNPLSYYILYNEYKHNFLALVGKSNEGEIF